MERMPDLERFRNVLQRVEFPSFNFIIHSENVQPYLQIECDGTCNVSGEPMAWKSRKWHLSVWMTDGEIVQTAFKAVMTAMEHEIRENFRYRGVSIFDPHYDIERLVELRRDPESLKERLPVRSVSSRLIEPNY